MLQRLLSPIVELRKEEGPTVLLMFLYSFFAMAAYNAVKPITRSAFIKDLGADNLPYVLLAAGVLIGVIMSGYAWLLGRLPRRWGLPITQVLMAAVLALFWVLFRTGGNWVSVAFYLVGLVLGVLLTSQFWTLANVLYDPRQAKRVFGFIGGGAPLGGMAGGALAYNAERLGTNNLLLFGSVCLLACAAVVSLVIGREKPLETVAPGAVEKKGVGATEALRLLRRSHHLQIIALVIGFAAIGAAIVEQQLNMAAQATKGRADLDAITAFLGLVGMWMSGIAFFIQVWATSRIHRYLGIGFALLVLPIGLGTTAVVMLLNAALWAPAMARTLDQSLRYTVDKTTREILFLPLPADLKLRAKPFVDVTVDRMAKAVGALLLLVLVQPWGAALDWPHLSYASLVLMGLWILMAQRARRGYLQAFRNSLERRDVKAAEVRLRVADLSTVEALVEELAHPDEARALYAIDLLESLEKRHLVTPLLLHHDSAAVRCRALGALGAQRGELAERWVPAIERLLRDENAEVRAAALGALATIRRVDTAGLVRPMLADADPRIAITAAVALADTGRAEDEADAERVLTDLCADRREAAGPIRRDVATAMRQLQTPRLRPLLLQLLVDPDPAVAEAALGTVCAIGCRDVVFVPTLISLLRNRRLKSAARDVLVSYGEPVVDPLAHFLRDPDEDLWVRRHLPATIARIPCQRAMDALVGALDEPDGFLRYKVVAGIERLRRDHPSLTFAREPIERMALAEARRYFAHLTLHYNLFVRANLPTDALVAGALQQKTARALDRVYRLLGLLYPWKDMAAARWAIERGDPRARASALEYLDNVLTGALRKRLIPVLDDAPLDEKVRKANVSLRTRPRDVEETLLHLINDDDEVIAAAAVDLARDRQMWALEPDLEHVLAHRDARDWHLFEMASWALAERRMPDERRRERWLEPLPAVVIADRLRRLPLFASVSVDELVRVAAAGRQARFEPGRLMAQAGTVPDRVQFLIDGRAEATDERGEPGAIDAPALIGFTDLLERRPARESVRAAGVAVTLALTADELAALLADNTDLVEGLFRTLVRHWTADERRVVTRGAGETARPAAETESLSPIDKVLALRSVPLFSRVAAEEMLQLAAIARHVPLEPGTTLAAEGDPPALCVVRSGELSLERAATTSGGPANAGPGDVVGLYETLAGTPIGWSQHVARKGSALRIEREDFFDLLGQRPALLRQLFGVLFQSAPAGGDATAPR